MENTLVLFAHPYLEHSKSNRELINFYVRHQHYTFRDLYEEFPDFHIPAFRERKRIGNYDRIIFHFPLIWFGLPPLLKLWIDEVFDLKWQDEGRQNPLEGKEVVVLVTTNYQQEQFGEQGYFQYSIEELISGLFVVLKQNRLKLKEFLCIYDIDQMDKKEIIRQKQHFMSILNGE